MNRKIIWANDGSPAMANVLPVVRRLARILGASIIVAHVHRELAPDRVESLTDNGQVLDRGLRQTVRDLNQQGLGAHLALTEGNGGRTAEVISDLADETGADLIVVGSRRRGLISRLLFGSFSIDLMKSAGCPVLLVPDPLLVGRPALAGPTRSEPS